MHEEVKKLVNFLEYQQLTERVQELERKYKEYVSFTESNNYNMDVEFEKLYKQNKRYRDLLTEIKSDIETDYNDSEIENMPLLNIIIEQINKALGSELNE